MPSSTVPLQSTVNFCSTHADLLPLANVGGYTDEPALTLCNDAMSDIFSDPNDYKFNRNEMPLMVTCPSRIDQLFAGAVIFSLGSSSQGWGIGLSSAPAITVSGGVVTVNTLEAHRFNVGDTVFMAGVVMTIGTTANYNSIFTDDGSSSSWSGGWVLTAKGASSVSFAAISGQVNADTGGAPGILNFAYATSASLVEMNNGSSPQNVQYCTVFRELPLVSRVANPDKVCILADLGTGVLRIRWNFIPGSTAWGLKLVYQAQPPRKVALTDTWAPIPDAASCLFNQALLYRMYRYLNSPTADAEFQKLQKEIQKVQAGDDAEPTAVNLQPDGLMDDGYWIGW
jgi:hypothetical protein